MVQLETSSILRPGILVALIVIGNMNLKETFDKDSGIYS